MSKQMNIRIDDDLMKELEKLLGSDANYSRFVAQAISMAVEIKKNMDPESKSRLVIENPKGLPSDYKLLVKTA